MAGVSDSSDFLVVGGGIAGAAAAYFLSASGRVTLLEAEASVGMHATGRSAALYSEYFGGPAVRTLTTASRAFYASHGTDTTPLLRPRGVLALGSPDTADAFAQAHAAGALAERPVVELTPDEAQRLCPVLRRDAFDRVLYKPGACDIDVDATHQLFLRGLRAGGGRVVTRAPVRKSTRVGGLWQVRTGGPHEAVYAAPVLVNAAGAWADRVAQTAGVAPAGLRSTRRTAALVTLPDPPGDTGPSAWPMVTDVADTFYAKPEAGGLLLSPCDSTPVPDPARRVRADDLDVAVAVERFHAAVDLRIRGVGHAWAGLRTSVADDTPVIGEDPAAPGFFWLAGLGGYGIQTAPAVGALLAALAAGHAPPAATAPLTPALAPGRSLAAPVR